MLGIDAKSHSSSIQEAQADRVRRRAERDGLTRPEQPEEPKPVKKAAAKKAAASKTADDRHPRGRRAGGSCPARARGDARRPGARVRARPGTGTAGGRDPRAVEAGAR